MQGGCCLSVLTALPYVRVLTDRTGCPFPPLTMAAPITGRCQELVWGRTARAQLTNSRRCAAVTTENIVETYCRSVSEARVRSVADSVLQQDTAWTSLKPPSSTKTPRVQMRNLHENDNYGLPAKMCKNYAPERPTIRQKYAENL